MTKQHFLVALVLVGVTLWGSGGLVEAKPKPVAQNRAAADALFATNGVLRLQIEIAKPALDSLRHQPHRYVKATLREGSEVLSDVGVHLRGSAGSFRQVDEKLGLTFNLGAFLPETPRFHGLKKFHLNNSVQDNSYLSEFVCGELFRQAGVPAARVTHALVELNGRKMGLYVLMESMDKDFFARDFQNPKGNLYGQSGGCEITDAIERMEGDGPLDRADLKDLAAATQEKDPVRRWARLQRTLDVERFISFMALEVMLCHWDGYTFARHNYRVYQDLDTERMVFLPHDMDQMMRDANVKVVPGVNGLLAQTILKLPETRARYHERFAEIFTNFFDASVLTNRLQQRLEQIRPVVQAYDANLARELQNHARDLRERIVNRERSLARQLSLPGGKGFRFEKGTARVGGDWWKDDPQGRARLEQTRNKDGRTTLHISAKSLTTASWRTQVFLDAGRYRFEAMTRTIGVTVNVDSRKGEGAGVRAAGNERARPNKLVGDAPWQKLAYEFEVRDTSSDAIELVCELRATKGEVWFDLDSLQLVRLK